MKYAKYGVALLFLLYLFVFGIEGLGKLTGDTKTEAEGTAEKVASKAKEVAEDAKEAVEGAIKGVKNIFHKEDK